MDKCYFTKVTRLFRMDKTTPSGTVVIPSEFLKGKKYTYESKLAFGLKEINVRLLPGSSSGLIRLSQDIFKTFDLCDGMNVNVKLENGKLKIGPLIGVFMNEKAVNRLSHGNPTVKMAEMAKAAVNANVLVYFFTVTDIIWPDNSVNAVFYKPESNSWERRNIPLPDVLYDRGGGFSPESSVKARELRSRLNNIPGLKKINAQHYFDKWDLHCRLSKHKDMAVYLPETVVYENDLNVMAQILRKHPAVYLKMRTGSNGKGIIRVRKQPDLLYEYSYFKDRIVQGYVNSLEELILVARDLMNNRSFIIQQGIDVLTHQGNKVDVRVLVQRDEKGIWQITSMPTRIAVNDCAVTSTRSGSKVYRFEDAFNNILEFYPRKVEGIKSDIERLIYTATNTLEKEYGTFGELGIDVAIDKNLKLWFIESNAKPAKDTILISGTRADIEKSFRIPFEYCKFLTGFVTE